jgi:pentatricopeptide repeat protein
MIANTDAIMTAVAVCAMAITVPTKYWSISYVCSDVGVFLFAVVAYYILSQHFRWKPPSKKSCQEAIDLETEDSYPVKPSVADASTEDLDGPVIQQDQEADCEPYEPRKIEFDVNEHVARMQKSASERNIGATMRTFRLIQQNGVCMNSLMYNTVLQAWINCGNVQAAEDWMEEMVEKDAADQVSFNILIKALVEAHALEKAMDLWKDMKITGVSPCISTCNALLSGFARDDNVSESVRVLEDMHQQHVQPTGDTLNIITKLINGCRNIGNCSSRIQDMLHKFDFQAGSTSTPLPRLAAVMCQNEDDSPVPFTHEVHIAGALANIKAVRRTLKQHGFLDKSESDAWPLDGHWETDHGLTVVIEGKIVRWSGKRGSKLSFTTENRSECILTLYGEATRGRLVAPAADASKTIHWANGDVWNCYEGRSIGRDIFFSQTMTKTLHDVRQDAVYRSRSRVILKCVSTRSLGVPIVLEDIIVAFLGNNLHFVRVRFTSKWNPGSDEAKEIQLYEADADICNTISRRHPRIGLRHCWADRRVDCCGQRTLVNGEEVSEDCFSRHIGAVCWA